MNALAAVANLAWTASSLAAWRRFRAALRDPFSTQCALLKGYLERNRTSAIGRDLAFDRILAASRRSLDPRRALLDEYRSRVPLSGYDRLEPYIQRIREGEQNVTTSAVVRRLVPSSGSASATKLLPFTSDLQREFGDAVNAWVADLHMAYPSTLGGRSYWSISPAIAHDCASAVPVGFDDDSEYLGRVARVLARAAIAVPDEIARLADPEAFRYLTLAFLAGARDLRLISVWHPSFLTRLLEPLKDWLPRLADDLESGTVRPPGRADPQTLSALGRRLRPDPQRARELRRLTKLDLRSVWPELAVVSCWTDGAAAAHADRLGRSVGDAAVQGKGLIATEAVVSIPFCGRRPLAIRSHFFEFLDEAGRPHLAHELQEGHEYAVVLTTGGGLYRYRLGDRVAVDGRARATPSIRFVGREDRVSDWFGEKLSDGFVAGVLRRLFAGEPAPGFAMLAPARLGNGVSYTLFVEAARVRDALGPRLERELRRNIHYAWCVDVRQLMPARVVRVGPGADRVYVDACVARGQRLGDVKPAALDCDTVWTTVFGIDDAPGIH